MALNPNAPFNGFAGDEFRTDETGVYAGVPFVSANTQPKYFWLDNKGKTVRTEGLEPSRPKALEPKSSASTNSATRAYRSILADFPE